MLENLVRAYITFREPLNKLLAALVCWKTLMGWIEKDSSPMLILIIIAMFAYPFIFLLFTAASFIPSIICELYISYKDAKRERDYNNRYSGYNEQYSQYQQQYQKQWQRQEQNESYNNYQSAKTPNDDFHKALNFYGLTMPFTEQQLRDQRKKLMKKFHPDAGGNAKDAEMVNIYFDILKKYAS